MDASPREKFDAAVTVIQTIPRNVSIRDVIRLSQGAFQPANSLLLKFYAYYKQATIGPCTIPRPAFYDVVGKAKWNAWNELGNMTREEAMDAYVDELKNIIEVVPHTEKVQDFVVKLGDFYELVDDEKSEQYRRIKPALHLNGDVKKSSFVRKSPTRDMSDYTRDVSEDTRDVSEGTRDVSEDTVDAHSKMNGNVVIDSGSFSVGSTAGGAGSEDSDNDEFCDTIDAVPFKESDLPVENDGRTRQLAAPSSQPSMLRDMSTASFGLGPHQMSDRDWSSADLIAMEMLEESDVLMMRSIGNKESAVISDIRETVQAETMSSGGHRSASADVSEQLTFALTQLQQDMNSVMTRLSNLEKVTQTQKRERERSQAQDNRRSRQAWWWPFGNMQIKTVMFLVLWPFIINWFLNRRRRRGLTQ